MFIEPLLGRLPLSVLLPSVALSASLSSKSCELSSTELLRCDVCRALQSARASALLIVMAERGEQGNVSEYSDIPTPSAPSLCEPWLCVPSSELQPSSRGFSLSALLPSELPPIELPASE